MQHEKYLKRNIGYIEICGGSAASMKSILSPRGYSAFKSVIPFLLCSILNF